MTDEDKDVYKNGTLVRLEGVLEEGWVEEVGVIVGYQGDGYYMIRVNSGDPDNLDDLDGLRDGVAARFIFPLTVEEIHHEEKLSLHELIEQDIAAMEKDHGNLAWDFLMRLYRLADNELIDRIVEDMVAEFRNNK